MTLSQSSHNAPAAQQQLGWQARLRWVHGICQGLPKVAQQLDEFLSNQSSSVAVQKEMQEWREAWQSFQLKKDVWAQASVNALQQAARKPPLGSGESVTSTSAPLTFELLSDDVVENKILASRITLAMGETLQPGFDAMRLRMQALEDHELPPQDMFRAESICLHLVEQWMACGLERKHLLQVLEPLQNGLAPLMESEYNILHKLLDAKGVSKATDAPLRVRRTESGVSTGAMNLGAGANSGYGSTAEAGWAHSAIHQYMPAGMGAGIQGGMGVQLPPGASAGLGMLARARHRALDAMNQLRQVLSQPSVGISGLMPGVLRCRPCRLRQQHWCRRCKSSST